MAVLDNAGFDYMALIKFLYTFKKDAATIVLNN